MVVLVFRVGIDDNISDVSYNDRCYLLSWGGWGYCGLLLLVSIFYFLRVCGYVIVIYVLNLSLWVSIEVGFLRSCYFYFREGGWWSY